MHMQLNESESRIAVAALQMLERQVADCIEDYAEPPPEHIHDGLPATLRQALDRHETLSTLTKKLATAGDHELEKQEIELTIEGLDRYLDLLGDPVHEDGDTNEFLLSPDLKTREHERQRSALLFERLSRGR